jgi:hypothetical protein
MSLSTIVREIDQRARTRPIGRLQKLRKDLKNLKRLPGRHIFSSKTTFKDYAFHFGGRTELQFNVGIETERGKDMLRHGVAFSLETSPTLPEIGILIPKVKRFNMFLQRFPEEFSGLQMWHYEGGERSPNYSPARIKNELLHKDAFIFLGRVQPIKHVDYELVLDDFDHLLSLYRFVEASDTHPTLTETTDHFQFRPGCTIKPASTKASVAGRHSEVDLRHNEIQYALYRHLVGLYGPRNVGTERPTGTGGKVDVVVRRRAKYWFYEIKIETSARACIREALAQVLEYSFWPGAQEANRLIIVGEPIVDAESQTYLRRLHKQFSLPITYQQFDVKKCRLLNGKP